MTKPESFILTTDYATLKNDDQGTLTVIVPASLSVTASNTTVFSSTAPIGSAGAPMRVSLSVTGLPVDNSLIADTMEIVGEGTLSGSPQNWTIRAVCYRSSATNVSLRATIYNPDGATLILGNPQITISAKINTFLPPF